MVDFEKIGTGLKIGLGISLGLQILLSFILITFAGHSLKDVNIRMLVSLIAFIVLIILNLIEYTWFIKPMNGYIGGTIIGVFIIYIIVLYKFMM
jgi:hypothetical protein